MLVYSGGAIGSDLAWEGQARYYVIKHLIFSFEGHVTYSKAEKIILTKHELKEADKYIDLVNGKDRLNRPFPTRDIYVDNLLRRDYYIILRSNVVYAIGRFIGAEFRFVDGGTGWGIEFAIDQHKPIYFFAFRWYQFDYSRNQFIPMEKEPLLEDTTIACIGTRKITEDGKRAIRNIFYTYIHKEDK